MHATPIPPLPDLDVFVLGVPVAVPFLLGGMICARGLLTARRFACHRVIFAGSVELRNSLCDKFGIELPPSLALDFPTAFAIATHIASLVAPSAAVASAGSLSDWDPRAAVRTSDYARNDVDPTAIVGISARYPGGIANPAGYWAAISAAVDLPQQVIFQHIYDTARSKPALTLLII